VAEGFRNQTASLALTASAVPGESSPKRRLESAMPGEELIETMVRAAVTDAFHQRGLDPEAKLDIAPGAESYRFMGVDLRQVMRAAVTALEQEGWMIVRPS
jgi:hypothetical protein